MFFFYFFFFPDAFLILSLLTCASNILWYSYWSWFIYPIPSFPTSHLFHWTYNIFEILIYVYVYFVVSMIDMKMCLKKNSVTFFHKSWYVNIYIVYMVKLWIFEDFGTSSFSHSDQERKVPGGTAWIPCVHATWAEKSRFFFLFSFFCPFDRAWRWSWNRISMDQYLCMVIRMRNKLTSEQIDRAVCWNAPFLAEQASRTHSWLDTRINLHHHLFWP